MKQTEVGLIPDDWEVKPLGDLAFVTKLAGFEFTAHVKYSDLGKIIALRGLNVRKGFLILDDVKYIDDSNFSKLDRSKLFIDDLLFTYVGTVGNAALVDKDNTYYLAPNVALIRCNKHIYPKYLMYLILSKSFFDVQISTLMSTTSQAALSMTNIRLFKILLPPLAEQQRIAKALSDVDALISTTEKLIQKKKNIKQGTMQNLLTGKKRLPGFGPQTKSPAYKQTELGLIPEDWDLKNLGDVVTFLDKKRIPITESERKKGIYPYYGASGIIDYVNNYIFDGNYVLLGEDGANIIDRSSRLAFVVHGKCWINNHAHVLLPNENMNLDFLSEYLESLDYTSYNTGTAQPKLNREKCNSIPIVTPSFAEQTAFANVLSSMDKEIETLNTKLEKYRNLKTAMMQQLLTGKIRLIK